MELRLSELEPGRHGYVSTVEPGGMAARLADLGLLPGTRVDCELAAPAGDPAAYRVRGALFALRRRDAALVRVTVAEGEREG